MPNPVLEPGFHALSEEEYHGDPAPQPSLSCSLAKVLIDQSPKHAFYQHPRLGAIPSEKDTASMDYGALGHALILGKGAQSLIGDFKDWRMKEAKEFREAARNSGLIPVLKDTMERAKEMAGAALQQIIAFGYGDAFRTADKEVSVLWKDDGYWMRSKLDAINRAGTVNIFDLKITARAAPSVIERQIGAMNYDMQEAFYRHGVAAVLPDMVGRIRFTFFFIEAQMPFSVVPVELSAEFQALGEMKFQRALGIWRTCILTNQWPSYVRQAFRPFPKPWDMQREQDSI